MGGVYKVPAIKRNAHSKYRTRLLKPLSYYIFTQFVLITAGTSAFLFTNNSLDLFEKSIAGVFIILAIVNCGLMFDRKRWVYILEYFRLVITLLFFGYLIQSSNYFREFLFAGSLITLISFFWLILMARLFRR